MVWNSYKHSHEIANSLRVVGHAKHCGRLAAAQLRERPERGSPPCRAGNPMGLCYVPRAVTTIAARHREWEAECGSHAPGHSSSRPAWAGGVLAGTGRLAAQSARRPGRPQIIELGTKDNQVMTWIDYGEQPLRRPRDGSNAYTDAALWAVMAVPSVGTRGRAGRGRRGPGGGLQPPARGSGG